MLATRTKSLLVLGDLIREGRLDVRGLQGLAEDKPEYIRRQARARQLKLGSVQPCATSRTPQHQRLQFGPLSAIANRPC